MALLRKNLSFSSPSFKSSRTTNIKYPKSSSLPPGAITEFIWKDYSPDIFRNIQELGGVDYDDYMQAVCNHETLMSLALRGGGSSKTFHACHDERFVIKTLKKSEAKVLMEILPSYYNHIEKNQNSLLAKYYGLHASRPGTGGTKTYFAVIENLLRTDLQIHKRYDLKGSSKGRSATKNGAKEGLTLKDRAFDVCFYIDPSTRNQILEQIKLDCKFLEEYGIMDYSLLIGMHIEPSRRDTSKRHSNEDTMPAQNGTDHPQSEAVERGNSRDDPTQAQHVKDPPRVDDEEASHRRDPTLSHFADNRQKCTRFGATISARAVKLGQNRGESVANENTRSKKQESQNVYLFIGIIDFLQGYTVIKRIEHAYKSLQYDSKTISSVPPRLYSTRFQDFLCSKVFFAEEFGSPHHVDVNRTTRS